MFVLRFGACVHVRLKTAKSTNEECDSPSHYLREIISRRSAGLRPSSISSQLGSSGEDGPSIAREVDSVETQIPSWMAGDQDEQLTSDIAE